tara:strand:- start:693 stop:1100 length:408 start_codon:yes stop_codon:yes gene_type:complete
MKYIALLLTLIALSGCSMKSFYPIMGGTVGAAGGAMVGGPGGAALGGFSGVAAGELAKKDGELAEAVETVEALSKGDVEKLLEIHASEQKSLFDQWVEGIYDVLKISAFGMALYFVFQFWYGRKFAEKLNKQNKQ